MTNAEKFKEVFGFELNTETDYYCPFNSTKCDNLPCDACIEKFWQSEYKEPKQNIFDFLTTTGIAMLDGERIADAEWKQAIEKIRAEISEKRKIAYGKTNSEDTMQKFTSWGRHWAHDEDLETIDKYTKELMK